MHTRRVETSSSGQKSYFKIAEMLIDVKRYQDASISWMRYIQTTRIRYKPALLGYCEEALGKNERAQEFAELALAVDRGRRCP